MKQRGTHRGRKEGGGGVGAGVKGQEEMEENEKRRN